MTQAEWLACDDPTRMLAFLEGTHPDDQATPERGRGLSERKRRLWTCAWWRSIDPHGADAEEVVAVVEGGRVWHDAATGEDINWRWLLAECLGIVGQRACPVGPCGTALLREIAGNPFRPVASPWRCPACGHMLDLEDGRWYCPGCDARHAERPWLTPTVLALAQRIYGDRDFGLLPVLADALEEAGCTDAEILNHLREREICPECLGSARHVGEPIYPEDCRCGMTGWILLRGPHVRGCAVLDLVLGKE